jgi:hypothetical protein
MYWAQEETIRDRLIAVTSSHSRETTSTLATATAAAATVDDDRGGMSQAEIVFGRAMQSLAFSSINAPLHIVRGRGQYMYTADGDRFLDLQNNVAHVGHCHPAVVDAACIQLRTLNTNTRFLHSAPVRYAKRLAALFPPPLDVVFFVNSGSEANELALRLAKTATGGSDIICVDHGYHGNTNSLVEISPYKYADQVGGALLALKRTEVTSHAIQLKTSRTRAALCDKTFFREAGGRNSTCTPYRYPRPLAAGVLLQQAQQTSTLDVRDASATTFAERRRRLSSGVAAAAQASPPSVSSLYLAAADRWYHLAVRSLPRLPKLENRAVCAWRMRCKSALDAWGVVGGALNWAVTVALVALPCLTLSRWANLLETDSLSALLSRLERLRQSLKTALSSFRYVFASGVLKKIVVTHATTAKH